MYDIEYHLAFLYFICLGFVLTSSRYPTIVWDPMNPFFACTNAKLNAKIGDTINLQCPTEELNFFMPNTINVGPIFENLYFLNNNKDQYNTCNATGMRKLLDCRDGNNEIYGITFHDIAPSEKGISFNRGETYYFIGTGFRTKENLNNTINGSCCHRDTVGRYFLKFEIYICMDDDAECTICKSPACYYRKCDWLCDPWKNMTYNDKGCRILQIRNCTNNILGETKRDIKFTNVPCPTPQIPETSGTPSTFSTISTLPRTTTTKPTRTTGETTTLGNKTEIHHERLTGENNTSVLTGFLSGMVCFIIGVVLGNLIHHRNYIRSCFKTVPCTGKINPTIRYK